MYANHLKYYADYTFADGYPYGLSVEIVKPGTLEDLTKINAATAVPVARDSLFTWIQKDINSFDIETEISREDLRMKRISLSADTKINRQQLENFAGAGIVTAEDFVREHERLESFCRTSPAYYQIQINASCPQSCSYCPYPGMNPGHLKDSSVMSRERLKILIEKIAAYTPDAVVCMSLWGEVSAYPDIAAVLKELIQGNSLRFLIETSGLGWDIQDSKLIDIVRSGRIQWIFSLDAADAEAYSKIRGRGYEEACAAAEAFLALNSENVWVQAVRMKGFEDNLEKFYRFWKEKTENVIIQKYDHFSLKLEEMKVTDLSPLRRQPCWHLKREMAVLADGSVLLCREDIASENILGNCFEEELPQIWERGRDKFEEHLKGEYCGICEHCDEYYSYNF
ncbi:MAG: spiro-SPASM protein, partial [Spirochaetales bacterium]|nr:spiro-SPASM protein [Spirochaetales bacterium]